MTNNNFNSNDFSNEREVLDNGLQDISDKISESTNKTNDERTFSQIEENQSKETNSKGNNDFSLPTTLKDYLIFSKKMIDQI